jgi:DNA-binding transcriptional ArsR family regulator
MMRSTRLEMMLHPTRMQILQALIGGRQLTAGQIGEELPAIPQATLYRQLGKLVDAGLIVVVDERPVRGTVERLYAIPQSDAALTANEVRSISKDEHLQYFLAFTTGLVRSFEGYIRQEHADPVDDGLRYRQARLQLTDAERAEFLDALLELVTRVAAHEPGPDRRPIVFTSILIPEITGTPSEEDDCNDDS